MKKFLVITSINKSTKEIRSFFKTKDWKVIVVGNKKIPKN